MARGKKPLLENIEIKKIAAEGKSIAYVEDKVLFVPNTVPGDIVDVQVTRKRKSFLEGLVTRMHHPSELRIKPRCAHFGICGGCKWQNLPYEAQLQFKQQEVIDNLERIGKVYASEVGASTVCVDRGGVSGEYRRPEMEVIFGTETESTRLENGILYRFDVTKVMFASGNTDERMRMRNLDCTGETVVDMFAGIGYFTLPLARFSGARRVFACEKNPESYHYLVENVRLNEVGDVVLPMLGDNRSIPGRDFADRILMGYVQTTSEFLPAALRMIRIGGIIHYHDTFPVGDQDSRVDEIFSPLCGYEVLGIREVKSFAPSVSHYVADVRITSRSPRWRPGASSSRRDTCPRRP